MATQEGEREAGEVSYSRVNTKRNRGVGTRGKGRKDPLDFSQVLILDGRTAQTFGGNGHWSNVNLVQKDKIKHSNEGDKEEGSVNFKNLY